MRLSDDSAAPAAIFIAALLLRVLFCFAVYPQVAADFGTGDGYDEIARNLTQGTGYTLAGSSGAAERLPLYPVLLAAMMAVVGTAAWPWQLAQSVTGALTCALVYVVARRVASRRGGLVAAGVCVIHPALIFYTARPLTETLYVLLVVLFVQQLARIEWRAMPVGILLGLQLLTKSTAWLHVMVLAPALLQERGARVLRTAAWAGLLLAPWVLWNLGASGGTNLTSATGGIALYHGCFISRHVGWATPAADVNLDAELALRAELAARGFAPDADIRQRDAIAGELAVAWIRDHPGAAFRLWLRNLLLTWYLGRSRLSMAMYFVLHGVLLAAAAVGVRRLWQGDPASRQLVVVALLLIGGYTAFHAAVQPAVRYILPVVPCAALLAAGVFTPTRKRRAFAGPRANRIAEIR